MRAVAPDTILGSGSVEKTDPVVASVSSDSLANRGPLARRHCQQAKSKEQVHATEAPGGFINGQRVVADRYFPDQRGLNAGGGRQCPLGRELFSQRYPDHAGRYESPLLR